MSSTEFEQLADPLFGTFKFEDLPEEISFMESIDALFEQENDTDSFLTFNPDDSFPFEAPSTPLEPPQEGALFEVTSPTSSPRNSMYFEPECAPVDKLTLKRKRSFSEALMFDIDARKRQQAAQLPQVPVETPQDFKQDCVRTKESRALTSSYRGVCWYKRTQRWVVQIKIKGVRVHIGYYKDELEAAKAYERAAELVAANPDIDRATLRNV